MRSSPLVTSRCSAPLASPQSVAHGPLTAASQQPGAARCSHAGGPCTRSHVAAPRSYRPECKSTSSLRHQHLCSRCCEHQRTMKLCRRGVGLRLRLGALLRHTGQWVVTVAHPTTAQSHPIFHPAPHAHPTSSSFTRPLQAMRVEGERRTIDFCRGERWHAVQRESCVGWQVHHSSVTHAPNSPARAASITRASSMKQWRMACWLDGWAWGRATGRVISTLCNTIILSLVSLSGVLVGLGALRLPR
jgi:hypothetical protein